MSRRKRKGDDGPPKVPGYLVSFGDMMTILLTFFILLCTYATSKSHGFIADGIGSFQLAIEALGLPGFLTSDRHPINLGADRVRYKSRERDPDAERDARRVTDEIEALTAARVSQLPLDSQIRIGLPIRFAPGSSEPEPGSADDLRHVAGLVSVGGRRVEIIGHADREGLSPSARDRLALRRAARVVAILHEAYGAPAAGMAAGAATRSRAESSGAIPDGDITVRVHHPERFEPSGKED